MMKYLMYVLTAVILFGMYSPLQAQPIKFAQAGMPFLKIDVGGRAGMAGTHLGARGDAMSMFYNPAAMAQINGHELAYSKTDWIAGITHNAVAAALTTEWGVFGVGVIWMDYGTFTRTIPLDFTQSQDGFRTDGTFSVNEYAFNLSYAKQLTDRFYFGGNLKFAFQDLGEVTITDAVRNVDRKVNNKLNNKVLDFGTMFYPGYKDLRYGVSLRNFSNQSDYFDQRFELPLTFSFGTAMDVLQLFQDDDVYSQNKLTVAFDWVHPRDFKEVQHLGLEYGFQETIFLRGGYKFNYDEEGLTAGFGFQKGVDNYAIKLEYVYSDFGIFDNAQRFSVGFVF